MKAKSKSVSYFLALSIFVTFACSLVTGMPSTALPIKTSESPQVLLSPNSLPLPNGVILNNATDTERDISSYQVPYLEDAADGFSGANQGVIDMYFGENHNFTVRVNSSDPRLVWGTGWCAQGQETLSQNLKKIQFEMAVNGQPVDLNQVYKVDDFRSWHTSGNICLLYRIIVSGLPSGTTTLTSKTIINEPINDGIKDYPAGELTRTYEVINSAETNSTSPENSEGGGITFQYPTDLIQSVDVVQVAAEIDSPTPHPSYTEFTLKGYPINSDTTPAQILVYPIKEFINLVPSIADDLKALKELKGYETDKLIPFPHIIYANPLFDARRSGTFLPGGISGYLFLTQFGQDISPITNEGLTYVFIGQSENGLLIVAFFPVNASGLPTSFKDVNSNEWQNNFPEYIKGVKQHLLSLQPNDFTPHLDVLDEIIYSIEVTNLSTGANPIQNSPTLGSKVETQIAIDEKVKSITSLAKDPPSSSDGITKYDVRLSNPNEHLLWWANGWCAKDEKILSQNLEQISFEFYINNQSIDLEKVVAKFYKSSDGLPCLSYAIVVYDWASGTTTLTSKIIIEAALNDGIDNYAAGDEFTKHIVVTVP